MNAQKLWATLAELVGTAVVGAHEPLRLLTAALLAGGHVLVEDVPGVGKTLLAKSFARSLGLSFARVQGTPDLLPSDVTGSSVLDAGNFRFLPGPVFNSVVLFDEINRATPRTQSALLEAMQEHQVSVDGVTHALPKPFIVLATQNPIELEGTFALPEAQLDRFLVRVDLGYLTEPDERQMLRRLRDGDDLVERITPVVQGADLEQVGELGPPGSGRRRGGGLPAHDHPRDARAGRRAPWREPALGGRAVSHGAGVETPERGAQGRRPMTTISRRNLLASGTALAGAAALGFPSRAAANENLPETPLVITPTDRPGQQGGTWNHALVGGGSLSMLVRYQGYEPMIRFNPEWTGIEPNVAESVEANDNSTAYTFHLRKGHRWSDGEPFTTEDIRFWYEDIFSNAEVALNTGQSFWQAGGAPGVIEIIDETTFKVSFKAPNGFFLQQLAWANQDQLTRCPAHYLKQFHKTYNPDADALAKARGMESWIGLFQQENGLDQDNVFFTNSKRPTLNAWMFTKAPGEDTERAVAVRNPYYFKVDTAGHPAALFRPGELPDGRRCPGPAVEDAAGRDRHDGPVHLHPQQQAGAVRRRRTRGTTTSTR